MIITYQDSLQTLLTRHRWGNFVAGTEHDQAAMDVIQKFIGDVLTQSRSAIKKEVCDCRFIIFRVHTIYIDCQICRDGEAEEITGSPIPPP